MRTMHFLSGLPRSGSTLLASILRQNPLFHSHIESPTFRMFSDLQYAMGASEETHVLMTDEDRLRVLRGLFDSYYAKTAQPVIFDNNRRWLGVLDTLVRCFPDCKVLSCVRPFPEIINSFERIIRKHPVLASLICDGRTNLTVYDRVDYYMRKGGVLNYPLQGLRSAFFGPERRRMLIINYHDLVRHPGDVMRWVHERIDEPPFVYDFEHILQIPGSDVFDRHIGTLGLHTLKPKVQPYAEEMILPPDIIAKCPPPFWDVKETSTNAL